MPAVVGFVKIISVGSSSVIQFGDALEVCPTSNSKSYAGSGSFLTGSLTNSNTGVNATNSIDPDVQDNSTTEGVNVV
ncbi:spore germination protein [Paenibacillus sp. IITD108]|uniref:spore germination protein n=1 Tax=Paenibacillus sp. IITD108 TaxID=3116649 RepID=UPI002F3FC447